MPDVTFPYLSTVADGQVVDADQLADDIYRRAFTPDSLSVFNGDLDSANLVAGLKIPREIVKRNTFTDLTQQPIVGATANLDFDPESLYRGTDLTNQSDKYGYPARGRAIAGLGKAWHAREDATAVLVSWHFTVVCGTLSGTQVVSPNGFTIGYRAYLTVDGVRVGETDFRGKEGTTSMLLFPTNTATPYGDVSSTAPDTRDFTGSLVLDANALANSTNFTALTATNAMAKGDHNVGFEIVAQGSTEQLNSVLTVRVRCRHMTAIPFYW